LTSKPQLKEKKMQTLNIHPFEAAGLGKAPFRFNGIIERDYNGQPGGHCHFCANGIRYCYRIESADGHQHEVGCECIRKLDRDCIINASEFEKARLDLDRKIREERRIAKNKKAWIRVQTALKLAAEPGNLRAALLRMPHPIKSMAADGKTYIDYIDWMSRNAGLSGMTSIAYTIERTAKSVVAETI
jgi:hypothetical protein